MLFAHELEPRLRVFCALDDDVLKKIPEASLDRTFVTRLDLEEIRDGAALADMAVRLREQGAGGIAVFSPSGLELFERFQAGFESGQTLLA